MPAEPGERDVVDRDGLQRDLDGLEARGEIVLACFLEGLGPEGVEVLGLGGRAAVAAEFVEREVEQGHRGSPFGTRARVITPYVHPRSPATALAGTGETPGRPSRRAPGPLRFRP